MVQITTKKHLKTYKKYDNINNAGSNKKYAK